MMGNPTLVEPVIHSHITDCLPDEHKQAYESVYCCACKEMVHAFNNECMQTWVETGQGNYCGNCFRKIDIEVLEDCFGLKE